MKKLSIADVTPGMPLLWHIYDGAGTLLLRKGYVVNDTRMVRRMVEMGAYRTLGSTAQPRSGLVSAAAEKQEDRPFHEVALFKRRLKGLLQRVEQPGGGDVTEQVRQLARDLQKLCERNADAALAALQIDLNDHYAICHPLHAAVVSELIARQKGLTPDERLPLVAAALTHDVGIGSLQSELDACRGPLSSAQWEAVRAHPERGAALLEENGVTDPAWLFSVTHHHERVDGTGYPRGLAGEELRVPARILAIADSFSSMVRPRPYREAFLARDGLRSLFQERGSKLDGELVGHLVKAVGVYPPGSLVRLRSGRIGVVTRRGENAGCPRIWAVMYPDGRPLLNPAREACDQVVEMLPDHRFRSAWGRVEALIAKDSL